MAWIESHQGTDRHPKTRKLCRLLGISRPAAVGHLHMFWWWAMDYAQDGDISKYGADDIADVMEWEGDAERLFTALIEAGFIDETEAGHEIHGWYGYAGRLIETRKKDATRKKKSREKMKADAQKSEGCPPDVLRTDKGRRSESTRDLNLNHNHKEKDIKHSVNPADQHDDTPPPTSEEKYSPDFEGFWQTYPPTRKRDKAKAYKIWQKKAKSFGPQLLIQCTKLYSKDTKAIGLHGEYAKMPTTYLNAETYKDYEGRVNSDGHQQPESISGGQATPVQYHADGSTSATGGHPQISNRPDAPAVGTHHDGGRHHEAHTDDDIFVRR